MGKNKMAAKAKSDRAGAPADPGKGAFARLRGSFHLRAALLILVLVLVYIPAIRGGYIWDDNKYLTENQTVRTIDGLKRIWLEPKVNPQYYPLVFTGFWLEHRLWGLNPMGYHLVNVLLHGLSAVLVWVILRRLSFRGAWLAAALFALHPVHVESVAWITERKNVLSGLCYLGSMLAYFHFEPPEGEEKPGERRWDLYAVSLALFALALLSKTITSSLPAAILLVMWWKRGRLTRKDVVFLIPMFIVGAAMGLHTAYLERHHVGALGQEWSLTFLQRCVIAGKALWFYAGKLAWPNPLVFIYPRWSIGTAPGWQLLFPAGAVATAALLWTFRRRLGRGPLTAVLFFAGTLFPALGFINVYPMRFSFVADHFQYLASLGLIVLFAGAVTALAARFRLKNELFLFGAAAPLLVVLGALTWRQGHVYRNTETLWKDTVAKNPEGAMPHCNLGTVYFDRKDYERARFHYERALQIDEDYALAHNNLGLVLSIERSLPQAKYHLERALAIRPDFGDAYKNLGSVYYKMGNLRQAESHYEKALSLRPDLADARYNLNLVRSYLRKSR